MIYRKYIKPSLDFLFALLLLSLLSPFAIVITCILWITNDGKPFFFQLRPGKNEKIFGILKFKTMNDKKDSHGELLSDQERITGFGLFLRKSSLDEIPQLINVIKGDMSFVGPRPLRVHYLPYYTEAERKRHSVRPGITGLAQVSGRNLLNWDDRLLKDIEYVNNMSFYLDIRILFKTFLKVLTSEDVAVDQRVLMDNFDDYRKKQ
ncbi:sugar transferase [Sediminicola arcticus]|jgi:undecaprenyl phosphate N,N'-diacetylbacillosamine 1-phosphate transferase|uniref:Sugar transferase n=1 Tax=Sediminicola arcticus TaxID=1574308 RepID=A0ABV2SV17_9FLAO